MNKLILATGSNLNYLHKMTGYLKSIEANSNFDSNYLILLGDDEMKMKYEKIIIVNVFEKDIKSLNQIFCLQHGEFLMSKKLDEVTNDNDVIFFTDGDMWIQRPLTENEMNRFRDVSDSDVFVGYNAAPTDTLYNEAGRLGVTGYASDFLKKDLKNIKIYNTGVLGMNKKTWLKLMKTYNENYQEINKTFVHYAKQQWLISFIIGTEDYNIIEMGYDLHNHTHYASPIGTKIDNNGLVTFEDKIVLFKHKWN